MDNETNQISMPQQSKIKIKASQKRNENQHSETLMNTLTQNVCDFLKIPLMELDNLLIKNHLTESESKICFLRLIERYQLDPFLGEISSIPKEGGSPEHIPLITIDGWMSIMNAQATFQGVQFREGEQGDRQNPQWMECSIYRSDRIHPITVREYFDEVKTIQEIWQQMPRRMLRHKVLIQAIRLAFGISQGKATLLTNKSVLSNDKNMKIENQIEVAKPTQKLGSQPRMQLLKKHLINHQSC